MAEVTPQKPADPQPKGFVDDIVAAILNPGYIGSASLVVINVALFLVAILIALRVFSDPRGIWDLENSIHLFALIPCAGLLFSINWYAYMVSSIKNDEQSNPDGLEESSKKEKKKEKKKKAD